MTLVIFLFYFVDTLMLSKVVLALIVAMLHIGTWLIRANEQETHVSFHCDISVTSADVVSNQFHPFHVCWRLLSILASSFEIN